MQHLQIENEYILILEEDDFSLSPWYFDKNKNESIWMHNFHYAKSLSHINKYSQLVEESSYVFAASKVGTFSEDNKIEYRVLKQRNRLFLDRKYMPSNLIIKTLAELKKSKQNKPEMSLDLAIGALNRVQFDLTYLIYGKELSIQARKQIIEAIDVVKGAVKDVEESKEKIDGDCDANLMYKFENWVKNNHFKNIGIIYPYLNLSSWDELVFSYAKFKAKNNEGLGEGQIQRLRTLVAEKKKLSNF